MKDNRLRDGGCSDEAAVPHKSFSRFLPYSPELLLFPSKLGSQHTSANTFIDKPDVSRNV